MGKLITVYWRDIPAQLIARVGRESVKRQLPERFQVAVDRAAMRAGKGSSDAYLADWRREAGTFEGDAGSVLDAEAKRIESEYDEARLERMVKAGGVRVD